MPGVSRSGITITASRFLGLDRDASARFSFLLLLPITFGAVVFKGLTDVVLADLPAGTTGPFVVGVLASLGSGLVAILWLLDYVRRHTYDVFVVYRLIAAAINPVPDRDRRPERDLLAAPGGGPLSLTTTAAEGACGAQFPKASASRPRRTFP